MACVIGRLVIVPLSQAGNFEINGREYTTTLNKNELITGKIIS